MIQRPLDPIIEFRESYCMVQYALAELSVAAEKRYLQTARAALGTASALTGPLFRFEEESLFPAIKAFLGEHVDRFVGDHDGAIKAARTVASLLGRPNLTEGGWREVVSAARVLLVHVSKCDGVNNLAERLSSKQLEDLAVQFQKSMDANVPLLKWADTTRLEKVACSGGNRNG